MSLTEVVRTCIFLTLNGLSKGLNNKVWGDSHQPVLPSGIFQRYVGFEFFCIFKILGYKNSVHFLLDILKDSHLQHEKSRFILSPRCKLCCQAPGRNEES